MKIKYVFKKYKKSYPKLFEKEKRKLKKIIPFSLKIKHVGSTAVPGLGGKGIIDILLVVNKKDLIKAKIKLIKKDYKLMQSTSTKDRISFKKFKGLFLKKRIHIHITYKNSNVEKEMLKFLKNLKNNSQLRKKYESLKKQAVKIAQGEGKIYRKYKKFFIGKNSK